MDKANTANVEKKKSAKKKIASPKKAAASSTAKGKPWTFPKNLLEDALKIPKAIEEKNAGNPMPANELAKAVGYKSNSDWRFLDLLRSANLYGLVSGTGKTATISMEKHGQDIVAPGSPMERQKALLEAFKNVDDFNRVNMYYGDKKIPEDEFFINTLTREFKIPRDRADLFREIFIKNLNYLKAFDATRTEADTAPPIDNSKKESLIAQQKMPQKATPRAAYIREYLDTCFVLMPFGEWFDKYYQDIYIHAIKEAGYEPIRADELFSTGSVVEQIWEQIQKAKVLIADLSGKNANVFYELGLSHAAKKPVVFISSNIDDIPFDLRHLRVVIYDVREPDWASKLKTTITDYLKNAIKEPEKSIPHPFRINQDENSDE